MESNLKLSEIQRQIEYYLSDDNLAHDQFFHNTISSDPDGYLDLDFIASCNKVKKSLWTRSDLIAGIEQSHVIELSPNKQRVRRKGNPCLPEFTLLNKKKRRDKDKESHSDPLILTITSNKPTNENWKSIEEKFKEMNPSITVLYARFKETEGNLGIIGQTKGKEVTWTPSFKLNDIHYDVVLCEGVPLKQFWKDHGSHMTICSKPKKKKKNKGDDTKLSTPVELGGSVFHDIGFIKNRYRKILSTNIEGDRIGDSDQAYILDLLKYDHRRDKLIKDLDYFTTGKVDEHCYSTSFYAVNKDGKREGFILNKCVEKLLIENKKNSKRNR